MKRLMKSMVLMAAVAVALASCAKENVSEQDNGGQKFAEVSFKAEIPAYKTTKSTIDVDGLVFNTRWAEGDRMGMSYSYGETGSKTEEDNVPAKYSKDGSYTVSLPAEYTGTWEYYVYYPYQSTMTSSKYVEIPFGSERSQTGNAINPAYDIMHGIHGTKNSAAGKENDGTSIRFDMERLTSLLHFHFTSSLNEKVLKATLSVDGDPIAADKYVMHVDMTNAAQALYTTGQTYNEIMLNITEATADDFSLWFSILPYDDTYRDNGIENIRLVVETETKTFSITNPNTDVDIYEAGQIHSITAAVPDNAWKDKTTPEENKVFFYESFDKNDGTGGNDDNWKGSIATETDGIQYDKTGWDGTNIYKAKACIKLGKSDAQGSITSPSLGITTSGTAKVSFLAAAWDNSKESTTLNISISGSGSIDTKSVTLVKGAWTEYTCTINGADKDTKVTFSASQKSNNRFFLDEVYVYTGEKPSKPVTPALTLSAESAAAEANATEASFDIQSNVDWTVSTEAEWITEWTKSGSNDGTVVIKFDANRTDAARTATFTVKTTDNAISKTFTLTQKAAGAATTVTDVLTAADFKATDTEYTDFSNTKKTSTAVYSGNSAKSSAGAIQLRSKNSNSGIVTTASGGTAKSVKIIVASGSNTIDVYGSNTAYTGASDLYKTSGTATQGAKIGSLKATGTITIDGTYKYIGIRSNNGAVYISSIEIVWE